ncbi:MAG: hypothetical protein JXR60_08840 [Bacteroidales bacterium]|nr:hypothetical protein [Bacteroidales bacterium]
MKKTLITILFLFYFINMFSQKVEYGFQSRIFKIEGTKLQSTYKDTVSSSATSSLFSFNIMGGIQMPIFYFNENMGLSLKANISGGYFGAHSHNGPGGGLNFYIPAYVMFNFGNGFNDSEYNNGFGFGFGYSYSMLILDDQLLSEKNPDAVYHIKKPSALLEFSSNYYTFRAELQLSNFDFTHHAGVYQSTYHFSSFSISILTFLDKSRNTIKIKY